MSGPTDTPHDDPMLAENFTRFVRLLITQHVVLAGCHVHQTLVRSSRGPARWRRMAKLSGHAAWKGLKETEMTLKRQGVWFSLLMPEAVCQQLVNAYVEIKWWQVL